MARPKQSLPRAPGKRRDARLFVVATEDTFAPRQRRYRIAMSNPCFDLWLLLHHEKVAPGTVFPSCDAVGARIRSLLGQYSKINLKSEHYPLEKVLDAIARARTLDPAPSNNAAADYWPETTGTRVFLLMNELQSAGFLPLSP